MAPTANTVHQPAAMRYDIMTKNKEKKGLRRGMENGGKKNDFFVTSAKLHIPLSWKILPLWVLDQGAHNLNRTKIKSWILDLLN